MEEIRRTNVSFRAKRTRYRCSLQFQSTLSDTHRSGHRFANLSLFLRIVIDQEDGGKFYPSKVIDTISRFEREKKSSIFVQNFVKKKKKSAARVKQCSYEIRFVFGRVPFQKICSIRWSRRTMELRLSHVHSLKRNFTIGLNVPSIDIIIRTKNNGREWR